MNQEVAEAAHAFEIDQLGSQSAVGGCCAGQTSQIWQIAHVGEQEANMCVSQVGKGSLKCSLKHWKPGKKEGKGKLQTTAVNWQGLSTHNASVSH